MTGFVPGCVKVMWERPTDDPDDVPEMGSGNYCTDHFAAVIVARKQEGFDAWHQWHDSDWGQGCEACSTTHKESE